MKSNHEKLMNTLTDKVREESTQRAAGSYSLNMAAKRSEIIIADNRPASFIQNKSTTHLPKEGAVVQRVAQTDVSTSAWATLNSIGFRNYASMINGAPTIKSKYDAWLKDLLTSDAQKLLVKYNTGKPKSVASSSVKHGSAAAAPKQEGTSPKKAAASVAAAVSPKKEPASGDGAGSAAAILHDAVAAQKEDDASPADVYKKHIAAVAATTAKHSIPAATHREDRNAESSEHQRLSPAAAATAAATPLHKENAPASFAFLMRSTVGHRFASPEKEKLLSAHSATASAAAPAHKEDGDSDSDESPIHGAVAVTTSARYRRTSAAPKLKDVFASHNKDEGETAASASNKPSSAAAAPKKEQHFATPKKAFHRMAAAASSAYMYNDNDYSDSAAAAPAKKSGGKAEAAQADEEDYSPHSSPAASSAGIKNKTGSAGSGGTASVPVISHMARLCGAGFDPTGVRLILSRAASGDVSDLKYKTGAASNKLLDATSVVKLINGCADNIIRMQMLFDQGTALASKPGPVRDMIKRIIAVISNKACDREFIERFMLGGRLDAMLTILKILIHTNGDAHAAAKIHKSMSGQGVDMDFDESTGKTGKNKDAALFAYLRKVFGNLQEAGTALRELQARADFEIVKRDRKKLDLLIGKMLKRRATDTKGAGAAAAASATYAGAATTDEDDDLNSLVDKLKTDRLEKPISVLKEAIVSDTGGLKWLKDINWKNFPKTDFGEIKSIITGADFVLEKDMLGE